MNGWRWSGCIGTIQGVGITWKLEDRVTKEVGPLRGLERRQITCGGGDSGKPIIKDNVELGSDSSSVGVEKQRNSGSKLGGKTKVDMSGGTRLPTWNLLPIGNPLVKNKDGTTPNMEIVKLGVGPALFCEDVSWRETIVGAGHVVVDEDGMIHSHGPQLGISNFRPMNCSVKEHGAGTGHDVLDSFLSQGIGVMTTSSSKPNRLFKLREVIAEGSTGEAGVLVGSVGLWDDSVISTHELKQFFCSQGLVGVQRGQVFNVDKAGRCINKDHTTFEHLGSMRFAKSSAEAAQSGGDKVIN